MKFTTPANDFLEALKIVQARCRGASIEILRHIRFDVAAQQLTMTGHDMNASCEAYLGVDDPEDGSCAVPGDAIVRLVGSLPKAAHLTIERVGQQIAIKSGKSRYKIPVLGIEGFPEALACDGGQAIELSGEQIGILFGRTRLALDPRDTRAFGQGLYLHMADGHLCTCGISLFHFARLQVDARISELAGVNIPLSAVDEIAKIGKDGGYLTVSERSVAIEAKGRRFCSKLIEEKYPSEYAKRLPGLAAAYVDVDREELLAAVRRLTSIAETASVIDMGIGDGEIVLSMSGLGEGIETVHCSFEGKVEGFVSIAAQRCIEMLEMPKGEVIQLHFTKGSMAVRIHDPSDPTFILVESTRIPKGHKVAA